MAIYFNKAKPALLPWVVWVSIIATCTLSVIFLLPESPKREVVTLSSAAKTMLATPTHTREEIAPILPVSPTAGDTPVTTRMASVAEQFAPIPYGADAVGAPGAWDGKNADGANSEDWRSRDQFGQLCPSPDDIKSITIATLHALLPPVGVRDECNYRAHFVMRDNTPPADVLTYGSMFSYGYLDLEKFYKSRLWSIADFEQLAKMDLGVQGILSLYLILKNAHSPVAEDLQKRQDLDLVNLSEFLKTGKCPWPARVENFCFD